MYQLTITTAQGVDTCTIGDRATLVAAAVDRVCRVAPVVDRDRVRRVLATTGMITSPAVTVKITRY